MAKKEIRVITASEDVASIIDQGAAVDVELKNLDFKDKGFKAQITKASESLFESGESSVRVLGVKSKAVVTAVDKYALDVDSESFQKVFDASKKGFLADVIKESRSLNIPNDKIDEALAALVAAGIGATITTTHSLDGKCYSKFTVGSSEEREKVKDALDECVSKSTSFRVKYEENK